MSNEYKAKVVILTGQPIERADLGRFVVDLATITTHKDRLSVDFDHDEQLPLGYIENIEYIEGIGLVGVATFSAPNENDKAAEILQRLIDGFPFEVSPTLELYEPETLADGEKTTINGYEVEGELDIYRNVKLRGVGIVLFGTDPNTKITELKNEKLITLKNGVNMMSKKITDEDALVKLADTTETEQTTEKEEKKPEYLQLLEDMISAFGIEAGVNYYRQGLTIEEAEKLDYAELKKLRDKLANPKEDEEGNGNGTEGDGGETGDEGETTDTTEPEPTAEDEKEKEELKNELESLKDELTKLRAAFGSRGEDTPVSVSKKQEPDNLSAVQRMANKIKRNGIKRA